MWIVFFLFIVFEILSIVCMLLCLLIVNLFKCWNFFVGCLWIRLIVLLGLELDCVNFVVLCMILIWLYIVKFVFGEVLIFVV